MAVERVVRKALKSGRKLHTHAVRYSRADNGGIRAEVERHTKDGAHHHTEHHVLTGPDDAAQHLQEQMGDQPNIGQAAPPPDEAEGQEMQGAGGGGGMAAPPAQSM